MSDLVGDPDDRFSSMMRLNYSRYGARLAEPAGIPVNGEVAKLVQDDYWIG